MARTTVETQLAKLRKAKELIEKKEKELLGRAQGKILDKIALLAAENGISAAQIAEALKAGKPKASNKNISARPPIKVAPKYRNPANAGQTWTGRGRTPLWVKAMQEAGTLDSALIK